ncbi:hypothetical protein CUMW_147850 [Citrus unshiu]|nr:hypothetical protein CUMW_147850 [Citrus unshiu]
MLFEFERLLPLVLLRTSELIKNLHSCGVPNLDLSLTFSSISSVWHQYHSLYLWFMLFLSIGSRFCLS